jgi:tetratricopeptide (TPR) repeat protein
MKKFLVLTILSLAIFFICGAPTISFRVLRPSVIYVPEHIGSVAIIDRSGIPKNSDASIEGGLTAELPGSDRVASTQAIEGLIRIMENSGRYHVTRTAKYFMKNSAPESFPEPLPWAEISKLCEEFDSDAILSLEAFDSDYILPTNMVRVTVGFRFYDPKESKIIDQNLNTREMVWEAPEKTVGGLINRFFEKEDAIKDVSYDAGAYYGERVSPYWYTIQREYYRKPKKDRFLTEGARMMEVNDWDAAIEALKKALESDKRKTRGRAAHNLAVVYEILGEYEAAQEYARDAWGKYENKDSKDYSYILGQRIRENQALQEQ